MILRYCYGRVIATDAVVLNLDAQQGDPAAFQVERMEDGGIRFRRPLQPEDVLCGLSDSMSGINRRGNVFENDPLLGQFHGEMPPSRFFIQNDLIVIGRESYGVFVDAPTGITFDLGATESDVLEITSQDGNLDLYLLTGETPVEVARELRRLTGRSYVPPKWAFGYGQSRWSYESADEVRAVVRQMDAADVPLDTIYLDIDYMKDYRDFTVDESRFPDMKALSDELHESGVHLACIVDSGIIVCEDDPVCQEGVEKGYFCKDDSGENFVGAAWAGNIYLPDFLNAEVRNWFGRQYYFLLDKGVDGFWNDMNDPSLFYSPEQRQKMMDAFQTPGIAVRMESEDYYHLMNISRKMQNSNQVFDSVYHSIDGVQVSHKKTHNLYGLNMARSASDAMDAMVPERRILRFSRPSYVGAHRYGGAWTGDNSSWWSHLLLNIQQMAALNLSGVLFSGADLGGFSENCTQDLLQRWLEFGIFTPLMRNHASKATRRQEPYEYRNVELFSRTVELRYSLLPYLYSEFMKAVLEDGMYFRPLVFDYPGDERAAETEDQLMVGSSIMIAPVYQPNTNSRNVYLPEPMKLLRLRSYDDYDMEDIPQGDTRIRCAQGEVLVFLKPGCILPLCPPASRVSKLDENRLKLFANLRRGEGAQYRLYRDDGETHDIEREEHFGMLYCDAYGRLSAQRSGYVLERA